MSSEKLGLRTDLDRQLQALRCAARGPAAQGRGLFFAYPALIPQRASAPRKRDRAITNRPWRDWVFC